MEGRTRREKKEEKEDEEKDVPLSKIPRLSPLDRILRRKSRLREELSDELEKDGRLGNALDVRVAVGTDLKDGDLCGKESQRGDQRRVRGTRAHLRRRVDLASVPFGLVLEVNLDVYSSRDSSAPWTRRGERGKGKAATGGENEARKGRASRRKGREKGGKQTHART
jgi:hypothetical protein